MTTKPIFSLLSLGCAGLLSSTVAGCLSLEPLGSYAEGEPAANLVGADEALELDAEATVETSTAELVADAGAPAPGDGGAIVGGGSESVLDPAALGLDPSVASVASCTAPGEFLDASQLRCYRQGETALGWVAAQQDCQSWGGQLVSIGSREEDTFLAARLDVTFWTGANDRFQEGRMLDGVGQPLGFTNWGPGQPDDFQAREDCVVKQGSTGAWNDLPCRSALTYVCERADG